MVAFPRGCIAPLIFLALATGLCAPARAAAPNGDYTGVGNSFFEKISFRSGGKVRITAMGMTKVGTFEMDGKEVLITIGTETNVFEIDAQGCVVGGDLLGKYCKGGEAASTADSAEKPSAAQPPAPTAKPSATAPSAPAARQRAAAPAAPVATPGARDAAAATAQTTKSEMSGRYKAGDAKVNITLDFKPGQKVRIIVGGTQAPTEARNATYTMAGDQVSVSDPDGGAPLVLTRKGNVLEGIPEGESMTMKFVKQ